MRQQKRDIRREERLLLASRRADARAGGSILELTDASILPQRYRLEWNGTRREGEGRRRGSAAGRAEPQPWHIEIVEDSLDGRRVYPQPPRHSRSVDRLGRLFRRARATTWLFVGLALVQAAVSAWDLLSLGARSTVTAPSVALAGAYSAVLALVPAAVLVWRADAWRSARPVLLGAILWTTVPCLVGLAWRLFALGAAARAPGVEWQVLMGVATTGGWFGLVAMSFGLSGVRRSPAGWLPQVGQQLGVVTAMLVAYNATRWVSIFAGRIVYTATITATPAVRPDPSPLASIAGTVMPVEMLGLVLIGYVCISAWLTEEPQTRLWQCATAATLALLAVAVYEFSAVTLVSSPLVTLADRSYSPAPDLLVARAVLVAGAATILLAFSSAVWSRAADAEPGPGAPDDIFAWGPSGWGWNEPIAMDGIVAVAAGADHGLALDRDGHVGAWGDDSMGQTEVPPDLANVVAVAAGDGFSLALRADGTVVAWGANDRGQADVPEDLGEATAIAAGHGFGLALRSDGTLAGWGDATTGVVPVPALAGVIAISAGAYHALALRSDGTIVAWGDNSYGQCRVPGWLTRARAISAGGDFSLALLADGRIAAWGDDTYGQLDVPEGLLNVAAVSAGAFHAVALLASGDVVAWGGGRKQGEADHPWRLVDFKAVAAGDGFSLAIRAA